MGFGVSLTASSLLSYYPDRSLLFLLIGLGLCATGLGFLLLKFFGRKTFHKELQGFFVLDFPQKEITNIDIYDYSRDLAEMLKYGFSESKDMKTIWDNINFKERDNTFDEFLAIMQEASEYYLLEKLSTHLSGFFNKRDKYSTNELTKYERDDIPDILLRNRFLELFSKPMKHREAFIKNNAYKEDEDGIGKISTMYCNGAMYKNFDLVLPKKSVLEKNKDSIMIRTNRFTMKIRMHVGGINTYIPWEFCKIYLGLNVGDYLTFATYCHIDINFRFGALFKPLGWKYYKWVDSFITELEEDFGQHNFFDHKIAWDKTHVIVKSLLANK